MDKNCPSLSVVRGTHRSIAESEPFPALQTCLEGVQVVAIGNVVSDIDAFTTGEDDFFFLKKKTCSEPVVSKNIVLTFSHTSQFAQQGSGGVTDCPAVVQTRVGPKPSFNRSERDEDHDTRRNCPSLPAQHQGISAFVLGLSQRIGSAPPFRRAREAASPRPSHNCPHMWS